MFTGFFGVPQAPVRSGKLKDLSGVSVKLYLALCHDFERYSTRELVRTVAQLRNLVGGAANSHIKARKELQQAGLIESEETSNGFRFRLCNPETGKPWPQDPRERIPYQRKSKEQTQPGEIAHQAVPAKPAVAAKQGHAAASSVRIETATNSLQRESSLQRLPMAFAGPRTEESRSSAETGLDDEKVQLNDASFLYGANVDPPLKWSDVSPNPRDF